MINQIKNTGKEKTHSIYITYLHRLKIEGYTNTIVFQKNTNQLKYL